MTQLPQSPPERFAASLGGAYRIEHVLGVGGFATVYLAEDLRHHRRVAVKVLAPELSAMVGGERFLKEIELTARLQHPHILPLFDSGIADGQLYYVMPFVAGETLRGRLERERQLPVRDALRLASEVADALDFAHRHGIVHRDIKPENILLQDGHALVADFGIALAVTSAGGDRLTQTGFSLGTPQYMAPEQAMGQRAIDGRADIYALGAVTYEMLAGEPPFTGPNAQAIVARLLTEKPRPLSASRETVPRHVDAAVQTAIAKLPADRFATAREFSNALVGDAAGGAGGGAAGITGARASVAPVRRPVAAFVSVVVITVAAAAAAWFWTRARAASLSSSVGSVRFVLRETADDGVASPAALAPDGGTVVYGRSSGGLAVRSLNALDERPLSGTEMATGIPAISPDGRTVAFFTSDDRLELAPIDGSGPPSALSRAWRFSNATWAPPATLVIGAYFGGLFSVDANGRARQIAAVDSVHGEVWYMQPLVLADGHTVVFVVTKHAPSGMTSQLATVSLEGDSLQRPTPFGVNGSGPIAVVDGRLLYVASDSSSILAVPLDARNRANGTPVVVLRDPVGGITSAQLAANGTLMYTRGSTRESLFLVDSQGAAHPLMKAAAPVHDAMYPRLSRDGRRLAFVGPFPSDESNVWVYDLASGTSMRLSGAAAVNPEWMPDNRHLVFSGWGKGRVGTIWRQDILGNTLPEKLADSVNAADLTVTPDGRSLLFTGRADGHLAIRLLPLDGKRVPRSIITGTSDASMPAVSPDGRWLAYVISNGGRTEVRVRPFAGVGPEVQVSAAASTEPAWSSDGRRLFYRDGHALVAASVSTASGFVVTRRDSLFRDIYYGQMAHVNYSVMPDARHFVMFGGGSVGPETIVVVNWLPEMRAALRER
ncbi:MAG TPA: protein kinase [Gemmatimonadaceae bacterium]|jgi:serine/threonine-protein kinase|nr:protein kinase [Gemmatimonadaceae bacterium]